MLQWINGVNSNSGEGRTNICQLKDLILTLFGLIFTHLYVCLLHFILKYCLHISHQYLFIQIAVVYKTNHRGRDRMVVGFTTACAISANHHWCEFESRSVQDVQHYMIKFVRDLRKVACFLRVFRFSTPIKLTATI